MKNLVDIAQLTREMCLRFVESQDAANFDFYCSKDLSCMCFAASQLLQAQLIQTGYDAHIFECNYYVWGHAWVQCDGKIIDITHSQFGTPDILIVDIGYKESKECEYDRGVLLVNDEWTPRQKLSEEQIKKILQEYT